MIASMMADGRILKRTCFKSRIIVVGDESSARKTRIDAYMMSGLCK